MLEVSDWGLQSWSCFGLWATLETRLGLAYLSWLKYGNWSLIRLDTNFCFLSWFWRCKEYSCPLSLWGFGWRWRFLTGLWHLNFDWDMVIGLWYTYIPNCGSLSWFWRCKEHPCPLSPNLWLWIWLEVHDCCLASWSWFWYGPWSLVYIWSKSLLSILILKGQRTSMSFKS